MGQVYILRSKKIETLLNVTSISKLSQGHFSANITQFSEQLSLSPFTIVLLTNICQIRQNPLVKTASVRYLKSRFS